MPWRVHAQMNGRHRVQVDFSFLPPGYEDAGYTESLPYPLPKGLAFTANPGSALNPADEGDVSGVAARRVARVVVWMKDRSKVVARPRLAPRRVYQRHKWVRRLRFYDKFLPASAEPVKAVARDWSGHIVGRMPLQP